MRPGISDLLEIVLGVNGKEIGKGRVPRFASIFTANECLDIGQALGSPVSKAYYDKAPLAFNGTVLKTVWSSTQRSDAKLWKTCKKLPRFLILQFK